MATFQDEQSLRLVERDCGSLSRGVGVARPSETLRGIEFRRRITEGAEVLLIRPKHGKGPAERAAGLKCKIYIFRCSTPLDRCVRPEKEKAPRFQSALPFWINRGARLDQLDGEHIGNGPIAFHEQSHVLTNPPPGNRDGSRLSYLSGRDRKVKRRLRLALSVEYRRDLGYDATFVGCHIIGLADRDCDKIPF